MRFGGGFAVPPARPGPAGPAAALARRVRTGKLTVPTFLMLEDLTIVSNFCQPTFLRNDICGVIHSAVSRYIKQKIHKSLSLCSLRIFAGKDIVGIGRFFLTVVQSGRAATKSNIDTELEAAEATERRTPI